MTEEATKQLLWWGYEHVAGTFQIKRFFDVKDIIDANDSPFCKHVVGPFEAENRDEALDLLQTLISSLNQDEPSEVEKNFYHCLYSGTGGNFYTRLFNLIMSADIHHQIKLSVSFPEEVEVVRKYQNRPGYWENLIKRMNDSKS